jgi:hypothetical protein
LTPSPSSSSLHPFRFRYCHFLSLSRCGNLAIVVLPRGLVQLPTPTRPVLASSLRAVLLWRMHVKTLCRIRSNSNPSGEMAAEEACIPDPRAAWVRSTMTEAKI